MGADTVSYKIKIRAIHGIHSPEGDNNMSHFAPHLQRAMPEALVMLFQYGFMGFWEARWLNDGVAGRLAEQHAASFDRRVPEVWVTHSNGAAVAYLAVEKYGARPDMIVNFNPALDRWRAAPVPFVAVIHSDQDRWVDLSQWIPFHIWGDQGKSGYGSTPLIRAQRDDVRNYNASRFDPAMRYTGHTGAFDPARIQRWACFVATLIGDSMRHG